MNGGEFVEAQRRWDFKVCALKLWLDGIDDEVGRQKLTGNDGRALALRQPTGNQ